MSQRRHILPGFGLSLGYTLTYLSALVLIPLGALILKTSQLTWREFWQTTTDPLVLSAYKLTFGASLIAAVINGVFGLIVAWVLVRYRFPGRRFFDALIDFPFALPTAVAGLSFSSLYVPGGWMGSLGDHLVGLVNQALVLLHVAAPDAAPIPEHALSWLAFPLASSNAGVVLVLVFVGLPFVVRTVQPVLQEWEPEYEQAALTLGAERWTVLRRVIFPEILPAWLSGLALAFARAVGEYGSVVFISGNIPGRSQIAPQKIIEKLDDFKYAQATAIAVVLLAASLAMLLLINGIEYWSRRHERA
jgi:sulfate transport system permease protein